MEAMNNVLFRHCTERVIEAINIGSMELVNLKQNELSPEFVLIGLLEQDDSEVLRLFKDLGRDSVETKNSILDLVYAAQRHKTKINREGAVQILISSQTAELLRMAKTEADNLGDRFIGVGAMFAVISAETTTGPAALASRTIS